MSTNRSRYVISSDKLFRSKKSSMFPNPFHGGRIAKCPLCGQRYSSTRIMYRHLITGHPITTSFSLLPKFRIIIPSFKNIQNDEKTKDSVLCIICKRTMKSEEYTKHIFWSHPWILEKRVQEEWSRIKNELVNQHKDIKQDRIPLGWLWEEDSESSSIGDILKAKQSKSKEKD